MGYTDERVAEIATKYAQFNAYLKELKDIREDHEGVILSYVSDIYVKAEESLKFLQEIPTDLQKRLRIGKLEKELMDFSYIHINL